MKRFVDLFYDELVYFLKADIEIMKTFLMLSFLYNEINNKFILVMNILTYYFSLKCIDYHLRCLLYIIIFPVKAYMHVVLFSTCLNMFDSGIEITRFCEIWLCTFICLMKYNTCILIFSMIKFSYFYSISIDK